MADWETIFKHGSRLKLFSILQKKGLLYHGVQFGLLGFIFIPFETLGLEIIKEYIGSLYIYSSLYAPCFIDSVLDENRTWDAFFEHFTYPFQPEGYNNWLNITFGGLALGLLGFDLFCTEEYQDTPLLFINNTLRSTMTIIPSVVEENHYINLFYEDLKEPFSPLGANVITSAIFSLAHVPGDLSATNQWDQIALRFFGRTFIRFMLNGIYDNYGLPAAVTCHFLFNFMTDILTRVDILPAEPTPEESSSPVQLEMNVLGDAVTLGLRWQF